jgi:type IV secretory pathway protease TraF
MSKVKAACRIAAGASFVVAVVSVSFWNTTESIPVGLYVKNFGPIEVGSTVSFPVPQKAREYAITRGGKGDEVKFIKDLAAGPGDEVCAFETNYGEWLLINNKAVVSIHTLDKFANRLPQWLTNDCKRLGPDEWLPLGVHPVSFDGRYFGPIREADMDGPYKGVLLFD